MDLCTLFGQIGRFASSTKMTYRVDSPTPIHSGVINVLDRTFGTAARLGLIFTLYKLIVASLRHQCDYSEGKNNLYKALYQIKVSVLKLVHLLISHILMVMYTKGIENDPGETEDTYFSFIYGTEYSVREGGFIENKFEMLRGSCHCNSILFKVKAPSNIHARDCKGKIRYPHFLTKSIKFQLVNGSNSLSVYYVQLNTLSMPSSAKGLKKIYTSNIIENGDGGVGQNAKMAAHAFCNRCGVHIFRAPDLKKDDLEINVNCLDIMSPDNEKKCSPKVNVQISFYTSENEMGSGRAVTEQFNIPKTCGIESNENFIKTHQTFPHSMQLDDKDRISSLPNADNIVPHNNTLYLWNDLFNFPAWNTANSNSKSGTPACNSRTHTRAKFETNSIYSSSSNNVSISSVDGFLGCARPKKERIHTVEQLFMPTGPRTGNITPNENNPVVKDMTSSRTPYIVTKNQLKYYMEKYLISQTHILPESFSKHQRKI